MADNFTFTEGTGATGAADDVGGVYYPLVKLVDGTADSTAVVAVDVGAKANALRVAPANDITDGTYIGDIKFGESIPAGTNNIGDVDIASALPAGDNNIGNVDIASALPAGTNAIGKLAANDGVDIGDVDVASCDGIAAEGAALGNGILIQGDDGTDRQNVAVDTSGNLQVDIAADSAGGVEIVQDTAADLNVTEANSTSIKTAVETLDDIVVAEDAAHSTGDKGVMFLAVRQDSQADFGADGDYVPLSIDSSGAVRVTGGGGGTEYNEDDAAPANPTGSATLAERDDALAGLTPAEGDWTHLYTDANGALWVHDNALDAALSGSELQVDIVADGAGLATDAKLDSIITDTSAIQTAVEIMDDWDDGSDHCEIVGAAAEDAAVSGAPILSGGRYDTSARTLDNGDAGAIAISEDGGVVPGRRAHAWSATINSADASSPTQVKAAGGVGTRHYITSIMISTDTAMNVQLQDDAGTPNVIVENIYLAANGGAVIPIPPGSAIQTAADNQDIDVVASTSGNITVFMTGYTI